MTIDEAIKILELYMKPSDNIEPVDFDTAIKQGIQALKRLQVLRSSPRALPRLGLPGETKD